MRQEIQGSALLVSHCVNLTIWFKYTPPLPLDGPIIPTGWDDEPDDHHQPSNRPQSPPHPQTSTILPCYKKAHRYLQEEQAISLRTLPEINMMSNYDKEFPPLGSFESQDKTLLHQPNVTNPSIVQPNDTQKKVTQAEAVLNWQTDNMIAQNTVLKRIDHKLTQVDLKVSQFG